ncbi:hypothetical protein PVAP13_5NG170922 [Panicum virgatum]|uniref:Uncharacterized protein n=1 Tax=Panicum virgatum TaxID=38727 RepID=A0A8T0S5M2_PANVG|nr:hypothetical protein PVAP13_5NG170922 [Panicum virgatum]
MGRFRRARRVRTFSPFVPFDPPPCCLARVRPPPPHAMRIGRGTQRDARAGRPVPERVRAACRGAGATRSAAARVRGPPPPLRCAPLLTPLVAPARPLPRLYIYPFSPSLPHPWLCLQQRLGSSRT